MKKGILGVSFLAVGLLVATATFAQVVPGNTGTALGRKARELKTVATCEAIGGNVDKRIANFEKDRTKKVSQYSTIQKKLDTLLTRMEAAGYDTTEPRVSMVTLDQKIAKFSSDYALYQNELKETKQYACGKSDGEFRAKLSLTREQLKVVRQDAVDIRTFWAKTVKPQIEALKSQNVQTTTEGGLL